MEGIPDLCEERIDLGAVAVVPAFALALVAPVTAFQHQSGTQFTDSALSGICVFNLTTLLPKVKSPVISVNLAKDYSYIELLNLLNDRKKLFANEPIENYFTGLFHKNIGIALLKSVTDKPMTEICKRLSDKEIKALANIIQNWKFECKQCKDFSKAQVMLGGVNGSEVNNYTFESKIVKNLFICGEALDICGYSISFRLLIRL